MKQPSPEKIDINEFKTEALDDLLGETGAQENNGDFDPFGEQKDDGPSMDPFGDD